MEEWKNFILYKQWSKDEDVSIGPIIFVIIIGIIGFIIYELWP